MSFAEMFDKLVVEHGYTAYSLSSQIGISENLLNKYRRGKAYPGGENMLIVVCDRPLPSTEISFTQVNTDLKNIKNCL